jgi:site-specific recombinase XerD
MQVKKVATIYPKTHRSGNITWYVDLGKINGKRRVHPFKTKKEAEKFKNKCDQEFASKNISELLNLSTLARNQISAAIEKLKPFNASLDEAVDFFIKYGKPPEGKIKIEKAIEIFIDSKTKAGLSRKYIDNSVLSFLRPFSKAFPNKHLNEITTQDVEAYLYREKRFKKDERRKSRIKLSNNSIITHIKHLSTFYNFFIKKGYATLNPFKDVERPKPVHGINEFLPVNDVRKILQYALDNGYKAECACLVLILFCGVRAAEAGRLDWNNIKLNQGKYGKVIIDASIAKINKTRVNKISKNAKSWLELCESSGKIAPKNYIRRMTNIRKLSGINYSQNAARNSFCTYHLAMYEDAVATAFLLGHPNPNLLYTFYNGLANNIEDIKEEAQKFWDIYPKQYEDSKLKKVETLIRLKKHF